MIGKNEIRVIYGDNPKQMVKELLEAIRPEDEIDKTALIGIKPNLVVAKPASSGATTSSDIVEGLIEYLKSKGRDRIVIMEGSWVGARTSEAFRVCGYESLSKKYNVPLIDLQKDRYQAHEINGLRINVCDYVTKVDYLINVPVLKGHCQTNITCALKNMKGCIPNSEKRRFHTMGLHKPIAYLNKIIKQDLVIVDGMNGDLNEVTPCHLVEASPDILRERFSAAWSSISIMQFLQTCCPRNIMIFPGRPQKTHPLINRERTIASPLE
ncbi:MAG: DUF362 domain-containing protein [Bacillota bacterium]